MPQEINFKEYFGFLDLTKSESDITKKRAPFSREMENAYFSKDREMGPYPGSEDFITGIGKPVVYKTILKNRSKEIPVFYVDDGLNGEWYYFNENTKVKTLICRVVGGATDVEAVQFGDLLLLFSDSENPKIVTLAYVVSGFSNYPPTLSVDTSSQQSVNPGNSFVAPDSPSIVAVMANRVWILYRGQLFSSEAFDHDAWSDAVNNTQKVARYEFKHHYGDGVALKNIGEDLAIVFQEGIYGLRGSHPIDELGSDPFQTYVISSEFGSLSKHSFVEAEGVTYFLNNNRQIIRLIKDEQSRKIVAEKEKNSISEGVREVLALIPEDALPYVHAEHIKHLDLIAFMFHKGFIDFDIDDNTRALFTMVDFEDRARSGLTLVETVTGTRQKIESVNTSTNKITITGHGYLDEDAVYVDSTENDPPNPLAEDTKYYIVNKTDNDFELEASIGGGTISLTDVGSGTLFIRKAGTILNVVGASNLPNGAKRFDGEGHARINGATGTNSSTPYTAFSVEGRFKPISLPTSGNKAYLYHENTSCGHFSIYLHNDGGTHKVVGALEGNTVCEIEYECPTSSWTYVAFTWNGSTLKLYINGSSNTNTASGSTLSIIGTDGVSVGAKYVSSSSNFFHGDISTFRVSNSEKQDYEIDISCSEVSDTQNKVLFYDYKRGGFSPFADGIKASSSIYFNNRWFTGTVDGKIKEQLKGYTHNLVYRPFTYKFERLHFGAGFPGFEKVEITIEDFNDCTLFFEFDWSEGASCESRLRLDTSSFAGGIKGRKRKYEIYPTGEGEYLDLRIHTGQEGATFRITSMKGFIKGT